MSTELELASKIEALEKRVTKLETALSSASEVERVSHKSKKLSAREFLMSKSVDTDTMRALVLGYFLEHFEGMESFNTADLENAFRAAKASVAKNMNATVDKNIAQGFMMEAKEKKGGKKAWHLTATGEEFIATNLNR